MGPAMWLPLAGVLVLELLPAIADMPAMLVPDMIEAEGYSAETHMVQTEDGYLLQMHRIPGGRASPPSSGKAPVLLQHGLMSTSQDWLVSSSDSHRALGYVLADEGYDVWLGNTRGNSYSNTHLSLSSSDKRFWSFSLHEQAVYDLPAMIDYILEVTGQQQVFFVGHTSANTLFYMMASVRHEYNAKVRLQFSLSPVAFINKIKSLRDTIFRAIFTPIESLFESVSESKFLATATIWLEKLTHLCKSGIGNWDVCDGIFRKMGVSPDNIDMLPLDSLVHFIQMFSSGMMQQFDYGETGNQMHYDSPSPPEYDLGRVTCGVVLVASMNDILAPLEDMELLKAKLSNVRKLISIKLSEFDYQDFLTSFKSETLVYHTIIDIMRSEWKLGDNIQASFQIQKTDSLEFSEQKEMQPVLLINVERVSSMSSCAPDDFQGNGSDCQTTTDYSYYGDYSTEEYAEAENTTDEYPETTDDYTDDYTYDSSENISTSAYPSYDTPAYDTMNETNVTQVTNGQVNPNVTTSNSLDDTALPVSINTLPGFSVSSANSTNNATSQSISKDLVTTSPGGGVSHIKPRNVDTTATKNTKTTTTSTPRYLSLTSPGLTEKPPSAASEVSHDVSQLHSNINTSTKATTKQTHDNTKTANSVSSIAESSVTTVNTTSTTNDESSTTSHAANMADSPTAAESTSASSSTDGWKLLTVITVVFVYQFQTICSY